MNDWNREIGKRVGYWRVRRGLTRQQFADLVGRSLSWVDKIESGERKLARLPMLEVVAQALAIDPTTLTDADEARRAHQCPDAVEVAAIKNALGWYEPAIPTRPDASQDVPDLASLAERIEYACMAWLSSRFRNMGQLLPGLIIDAQRAVDAQTGDDRLQAVRHLVMTYRLTCSTLLRFEQTETAWMAADRAITAARATNDTVCLARASRSVARAMTESGRYRESVDLLIAMANRMEQELNADTSSMYGMLLLAGQMAAARNGDGDTAATLHERAAEVARRLGPTYRERYTAFGTTNVALHRLAGLIHLRQGGAALEFLREVDTSAVERLPAERRANFHLDLAEAYRQAGNPARATVALLSAERIAPDEVRCRPSTHRLIRTLAATRAGRASEQLRQLAARAGVTA